MRRTPCIFMLLLLTTTILAKDSHTEAIRRQGRLIVIIYPEQGNPFMSVNLDNVTRDVHDPTRYEGIDAELIELVAQRLGVEVYYEVPERFSIHSLLEAVENRQADMAASALTITNQRLRVVDFSRAYYSFHPVVIVDLDSPIREFKDVSGKIAAAARDSSLEEHLRNAGFSDERLLLTGFSIESVEAIEAHRADFLLEDPDIAKTMIASNPALRISFSFPAQDRYGFAVPKGSDLATEIDAVFEELEASGQLRKMFDQHLTKSRRLDASSSQP